jgi:hypothetical protein
MGSMPFGVFTLRPYSAVWGLVVLVAWWALVRKLTGEDGVALLSMALVAVDSAFLWGAGAGRMDIMCAALGVTALAVYIVLRERHWKAALALSHACGTHAELRLPAFQVAPAGLGSGALSGGGDWGLYIAKNPALWWLQFSGNAANRWFPRGPVQWLRAQILERFLYVYGLGPHTHGFACFGAAGGKR